MPKEVVICDVPIWNGEQMPGLSFTLDEKVSLVKQMNEMGVPQIQIHAAGKDKESMHEAETICHLDIDS